MPRPPQPGLAEREWEYRLAFPDSVHEAIRFRAARDRTSSRAVIRAAIRAYLGLDKPNGSRRTVASA